MTPGVQRLGVVAGLLAMSGLTLPFGVLDGPTVNPRSRMSKRDYARRQKRNKQARASRKANRR